MSTSSLELEAFDKSGYAGYDTHLAAEPDEKAAHIAPPSRVVSVFSSCSRFGLPVRE